MSLMSASFYDMAFRPTQGCQWIAGIHDCTGRDLLLDNRSVRFLHSPGPCSLATHGVVAEMPETTRLHTFLSLDTGSPCRYDG